jgi:hypothetical protein
MDAEDLPSPPRADLFDGAGWLLLGAAILIGSITMDRLENQDVPPYAVPGLLPGLLGIALLLLGGLLAARSIRRGAFAGERARARHAAPGRAAIAITLCVLFGAVLVGHGLPFWLAATLYVTAAILLLRRQRADAKAAGLAALIGLGAGGAITLVFQQIFLVRLP